MGNSGFALGGLGFFGGGRVGGTAKVQFLCGVCKRVFDSVEAFEGHRPGFRCGPKKQAKQEETGKKE
jgi:hypothetical protein